MLKRTNRGRVVTEKAYEHLKINHQEGMLWEQMTLIINYQRD
jgi:hypothetical protein